MHLNRSFLQPLLSWRAPSLRRLTPFVGWHDLRA